MITLRLSLQNQHCHPVSDQPNKVKTVEIAGSSPAGGAIMPPWFNGRAQRPQIDRVLKRRGHHATGGTMTLKVISHGEPG